MESLDQFRRLEVRGKARNVFAMSDHKVLHNITSYTLFFDFARIFSLFSLVFRTFKVKELKVVLRPKKKFVFALDFKTMLTKH